MTQFVKYYSVPAPALASLKTPTAIYPRRERLASDKELTTALPPTHTSPASDDLTELLKLQEEAKAHARELRAKDISAKAAKLRKSLVPGKAPAKRTRPVYTNAWISESEFNALRKQRTAEANAQIIIRQLPTLQSEAPDARGAATQELRRECQGGFELFRIALDALIEAGMVQEIRGKGRERFHRLTKKGREIADKYRSVPK